MPSDSLPDIQRVPSARQTLRRLFLTLFLRGRSIRGRQTGSAPKSVGQKLAWSLLLYLLFGLFALMLSGQPIFLLSAYLHGMTLAFLGMFVASSAGEILFNQEEADILLYRPIEPRDLLWAKVGVLVEVSVWLAGAFNLAGFFVGAVSPGGSWLYLPVHAASTVVQALFCTGCVVLTYQLCLRWFGRERLESLMTLAQVLLSVGAVLISQILPQIVFGSQRGTEATVVPWWALLLPPAWFAGLDDAIAGTGAARSWLLAAIGGVSTTLVLWLAFNKLAQDYEAGLQRLNERSNRPVVKKGARRRLDRILDMPPFRWWLHDPRERAAFLLAAAYLFRDRDTKLRIYPAIAPFLIFPIVFMAQEIGRSGRNSGGGFGFIFGMSYVGVIPMMAVNLLQFSQHWQASDVFRLAPLSGPGPLCHGARKAVLCLLTFPLVAALTVSAWFIERETAALVLLLPGVIAVPLMALLPQIGGRAVLLSQPTDEAKSAGRATILWGAMMGTMALSGVAWAAWATGWLWLLLLVEIAVVAMAYLWLRRGLSRAAWPPLD